MKLKLYDYKCFYLLNVDFGRKFQNPFSPKLFTEIFGDLIKITHRTFIHRKFSPLMYTILIVNETYGMLSEDINKLNIRFFSS